jgi:glycosyltransferase involved in cell wall biosynthesis
VDHRAGHLNTLTIFSTVNITPPKNIIHLSTVHPRYDTRIFLKECCSLAEQGHSVSLVVGDGDGDERVAIPAPRFRGGRSSTGMTRKVIGGLQILDIGKAPKNRFGRICKQSFRAYRVVRRLKPDLLHFHDPELIPLCWYLSFKRIRVIYDIHENVSQYILTKNWIHPWFRKVLSLSYQTVERILINRFSLVLAEASYSRYYDQHFSKNRRIILQNMPLPDLVKTGMEPAVKFEVPTVGYIGVVSRERGALKMVDACRSILDDGVKLQIKCIGPVEGDLLMRREFIDAQEGGWMEIFGYMPAQKAWPILEKCHVGLAILEPEGNFVESYPTKMFEYMAMGIPVIVSDFPLYKKIIDEEDCGIAVDPSDGKALTEALKKLLLDQKESERMGSNGKRAVTAKYNWAIEVEKLFSLINEL